MGRRAFVRLVAGGALAGAALGPELVAALASPAHAAARRADDGVAALGRTYLRTVPKEADRRFLLRALPGVDASRPVRQQLPSLQTASRADFDAGRVASVQGWQLSLTEARAAAAVALGA